jgi:hypothetical protein
LLSSDVPQNHAINFIAEYWVPEARLHIIKRALVRIAVKGKDQTQPQVGWIKIQGNNTLAVKAYDGSKIQSVKATLTRKDDPSRSLEVQLRDDGTEGDHAVADNVFSKVIPEQKFGKYTISIEVIDSFGNKLVEKPDEDFILH